MKSGVALNSQALCSLNINEKETPGDQCIDNHRGSEVMTYNSSLCIPKPLDSGVEIRRFVEVAHNHLRPIARLETAFPAQRFDCAPNVANWCRIGNVLDLRRLFGDGHSW